MGGDTGVVVFDHVPRPAAVQSVITEQIDALRHRSAVTVSTGTRQGSWDTAPTRPSRSGREPATTDDTPPSGIARLARAAPGEDSVADRLVQLDELRRRGIVSDAEFASKKAELLDRL
jgi:hypothetical protein